VTQENHKMSGVLAPKEDVRSTALWSLTSQDITKLLMAQTHVASKNVHFQMKKYVFKRKADGTYILNLHKTWEEIVLAARLIAGIENPKDVCVISGANFGTRAVLKFSAHIGATPIAGLSVCMRFVHSARTLHPWYVHEPDPEGVPGAPSARR